MKTGTSNGNSPNQENVKVDVEVESKELPPMPPGFHFVPSSAVLILEYLVKEIVGVPLASDLVKVRDGVQLKCTQVPAQGAAAKRTAAPLLTGSTKSRGSWWKIAARSTDLVTQQHQLRGVSSVIGDIRDPTIMLLFGRPQRAISETSQSCMNQCPWVKPVLAEFCLKWPKCKLRNELHKFLEIQDAEVAELILGKVIDKVTYCGDLRNSVDMIGKIM
ncbi:hypothetical protein ACET3Z_028921 [Daucus carota]